MAVDPYTHTFKFEIEDKTGKRSFLKGEIEFNEDGKASFKLEDVSEPLDLEVLEYFRDTVESFRLLTEDYGPIKKIIFKEK